MDAVRFAVATRKLEGREDPPALILGRRLEIYEVEMPSVDFAVEEKLPHADRAVLELAQALGAVRPVDVRAYLGLGPELSPSIVARLERNGLLRAKGMHPCSTTALAIEPADDDLRPGVTLTDAGAEALTSGARIVLRQRSLRLLMSAEPCLVLSILPPPMHAPVRRDPSLSLTEVPEPLTRLDVSLRASAEERLEALGLGNALTDIPGAERHDGRLLGCSSGVPYEVRPASKNVEAWLLISINAVMPGLLVPNLHMATLKRDDSDIRRLSHKPASVVLPPWLLAMPDIEEVLGRAGFRVVSPSTGLPFRVLADGARLAELLGPGDEPAPMWRTLSETRDGFLVRVRLRAVPDSIEAAHDALFTFLTRHLEALSKSVERAVATTWARLCSFWGWRHVAPPDITTIRERLWTQNALRGALCAGRIEQDLIAPYRREP